MLHLRRWLSISVVIFSISFSILFSLYHVFQSISLQAVAQLNKDFSIQVDAISNSLQATLCSFSMQVFYSSAATKLRQNRLLTQNDRVFALRELGSYMSSCVFADCITVYDQKNQYIYTTSSKNVSAPADQFYDIETAQLFLNRTAQTRLCPIWRPLPSNENATVKGCYSFMFYELDNSGNPGDSAIMINIPFDWYVSQLFGYDSTDSYVIMDHNGGLVAAKSEDRAVQAAVFWNRIYESAQSGNESGYLVGEGHGTDRMVCLYTRMKSNNWFFVRVLTYDDCLPGLVSLRNKALSILAVMLTFFVMGIIAVLIYIYFPFRDMISSLKLVQKESNSPIAAKETSLTDQMDQLIESSLKLTQERALISLLNGKPVSLQIKPDTKMALVLAECADSNKLRSFLFSLQLNAVITTIGGAQAILLIDLPVPVTPCSLCIELSTRLNCTCYYSKMIDQPDHIYFHYNNLLELRKLHFLFPEQHVVFEKMIESRNKVSGFSEKDPVTLINALHAGNLKEAVDTYYAIFESIKSDRYADLCLALNKLQQLTLEFLRKLGLSCTEQTPMEDRLREMGSSDQLHQYFRELFEKIADLQTAQKQQKMQLTAQQIARRIESGFDDPKLSAQEIAEEMGMSTIYLGRIFRAINGKAISDYINEIRIQHAKKLLIDTDQTVTEIVRLIGYENPKYFFVLFKRATGITPLQYRAAYLKNEKAENQ